MVVAYSSIGYCLSMDDGFDAIIHPATPDDVPAIASILVDTWRTTFKGLLPDSFLDEMSETVQIDRYSRRLVTEGHTCSVAAKPDGEVLGFASAGPTRHSGFLAYPYELHALYVRQHAQGRGLGRALFRSVATNFPLSANAGLMVWVLEKKPCRGFYQYLGGYELSRNLVLLGGQEFAQIAYGWSRITVQTF